MNTTTSEDPIGLSRNLTQLGKEHSKHEFATRNKEATLATIVKGVLGRKQIRQRREAKLASS